MADGGRWRRVDRGAARWLLAVLALTTASCSRSTAADETTTTVAAIAIDDMEIVDDGAGTATLVGNVSGPVASLTIEWGDGSTVTVTEGFPGVRESHRYADDGSYSVIVAALDGRGATTNRVIPADIVGATPSTTTSTTTTSSSTTTTTTSTTTTTVPPTTTTTSTTTPPTTTTTSTTTTTAPPAPISFDITTPTGGGGDVEGATQLPFRVNVASWWNTGNLHVRAAVGTLATLQTPWAEAWLYHDFTAQRDQATVRYTVSWDGRITALASAGSAAAVTAAVSVWELDGSSQGARIAREVVLDESLSSETINFATTLDFEDSLTSSISFPVVGGERYRVRLDVRCEARAAFALGATECTFGSNEVADQGNYVRWRDVSVTLE